MKLQHVTPENVEDQGIYCLSNRKAAGYAAKRDWFVEQYGKGLRLVIARDDAGKQMGFIEYVPAEEAWRPVDAPQWFFVHCLFVYPNKNQGIGVGGSLIQACEAEARSAGAHGVCVMCSKGAWICDPRVFEKQDYQRTDRRERFKLYAKAFDASAPSPTLIDWTAGRERYTGWHLIYADQCPYHQKAAAVLQETARVRGIDLQIARLGSAEEARRAPSGFGVFNLICDGRLLEDHYISATRFKTILDKELES